MYSQWKNNAMVSSAPKSEGCTTDSPLTEKGKAYNYEKSSRTVSHSGRDPNWLTATDNLLG